MSKIAFVRSSSVKKRTDSTRFTRCILATKQWRITDSNRWPPACKAGALASWANPPRHLPFGHLPCTIWLLSVVPRRVELRTSTLSVWRSNQLSYETVGTSANIEYLIHNKVVKDHSLFYTCRLFIPFSWGVLPFRVDHKAPERRCSSRTFRYGYLVTT